MGLGNKSQNFHYTPRFNIGKKSLNASNSNSARTASKNPQDKNCNQSLTNREALVNLDSNTQDKSLQAVTRSLTLAKKT